MLQSLIFPTLPYAKLLKSEQVYKCRSIGKIELGSGIISLIKFSMQSVSRFGVCPNCGKASYKIHGYYQRKIEHLPCMGFQVQILLKVPRFCCVNRECYRQTFAEQYGQVIPVYSRKSQQMKTMYASTALHIGGRAGKKYLQKQGLSIGLNTLLRYAKSLPAEPTRSVRVLGVDDWAFRKGAYYGTILVDLEKQKPIDLLPDRRSETLANWLQKHPEVEIITRDRASFYREGISEGAPQAKQVADRWHLLKNLGDAVERFLYGKTETLRTVAQKTSAYFHQSESSPAEKLIDKEQFTEDKSCEISSKRLAKFKEVKQLQKKKYSLRKISRLTGLHRQTVKKYALSKTLPPIIKANKLDNHADQIAKDWQTGDYTKKAIWEKLQRNGHKGSYSEVTRFIRQLDGQPPQISLSPRQAKWLLCYPPSDGKDVEKLSKDRQLEKYLLGSCEDIKAVANAARRFIQIISEKSGEAFDQWLVDVSQVPSIKNFAQGLKEDYDAVKNAITLGWSNGQVEGQVNRLKLIKRQMYGRANFEFLKTRVLYDDL